MDKLELYTRIIWTIFGTVLFFSSLYNFGHESCPGAKYALFTNMICTTQNPKIYSASLLAISGWWTYYGAFGKDLKKFSWFSIGLILIAAIITTIILVFYK